MLSDTDIFLITLFTLSTTFIFIQRFNSGIWEKLHVAIANCLFFLFMAACVAEADITFLSCGFFLSFFLLLFFLAFSQRWQIRCLPYLHTWCDPSANLQCRSEMCCTRFAENTRCKKSPNIRHLRTIAQLCRAISSQLRHVSTVGKKLQQYLLHMFS